jgi:CHAD domain-containing protein
MEIEAKFAVPDVAAFQRLRAAEHLAGFVLSDAQVKHVHDTYLDTAGRQFMAAGYAFRRRERAGELLVTLKGLRSSQDAIHRREELEARLLEDSPPTQWPAGPLRDRVSELIGEEALVPLFDLRQTRSVRQVRTLSTDSGNGLVSQDERLVAEWSLDEVHVAAGHKAQSYFELEVELAPAGIEEDLEAIVTCLRDEWGLEPELRSKFERALAFLGQADPEGHLLTLLERATCLQIAERQDMYGRRARALLALDEGATQVEAGECAALSDRRVRYWLAAFREQRLDVFPARILGEVEPAWAPAPLEVLPEPEPQPEVIEIPPQPLALGELLDRYDVDQEHARTVADHALALFDHLLPFHGLPPERRSLVEIAALVHNVGLETDPDRHHTVGRDILLAHPPAELDDLEREVVALTTFLHRKRLTRAKLERKVSHAAFSGLSGPVRDEALALAALVRMADGLDYSQTGSTRLGEVQGGDRAAEIEVLGPYAALDAERAQSKSDLWRLLFDADVCFRPPSPAGTWWPAGEGGVSAPLPRRLVSEPPEAPGLEPDDPMAEAARKTLSFHFQRMLYHEPGTRLGEDIEELHDMRVATRRMRAAFQVFGDYLDLQELRPIYKGLRRTGRALGAVRDLDVFWEKTGVYLDTLPAEKRSGLDPLRAVWQAQRERAREEMLAYLDSDRYARFVERLGEFLDMPGAGALPVFLEDGEPRPHRLRHVVPVAAYRRLAAVRAYDEWVTGTDVPLERLHQLRIAAKGLRYTLEYFREVLGPEAESLIKEVKGLQDHLGDLQDAVVASNLLRDFLTWGTWGHAEFVGKGIHLPAEPVLAPGVAAYLAARQIELQELVDTFPQAWERIQKPEFGQLVAGALAPL